MSKFEKFIVRIWGHSYDALGLLIIPTLIFTAFIAVLVLIMPDHKIFFFGAWCMSGIVQAIGVYASAKIRFKYDLFD